MKPLERLLCMRGQARDIALSQLAVCAAITESILCNALMKHSQFEVLHPTPCVSQDCPQRHETKQHSHHA